MALGWAWAQVGGEVPDEEQAARAWGSVEDPVGGPAAHWEAPGWAGDAAQAPAVVLAGVAGEDTVPAAEPVGEPARDPAPAWVAAWAGDPASSMKTRTASATTMSAFGGKGRLERSRERKVESRELTADS